MSGLCQPFFKGQYLKGPRYTAIIYSQKTCIALTSIRTPKCEVIVYFVYQTLKPKPVWGCMLVCGSGCDIKPLLLWSPMSGLGCPIRGFGVWGLEGFGEPNDNCRVLFVGRSWGCANRFISLAFRVTARRRHLNDFPPRAASYIAGLETRDGDRPWKVWTAASFSSLS